MKIDDIDAFIAVVRSQSLSVAADALQLTQSAITRRLQNFEEALGAVLLDRHTKPMKPTAIGWRVFERCQAVMREVEALRELVAEDAAPSGTLRLGVPQTIGDAVLLEALQGMKARFPELQVQVAQGWGGNLVQRIERRELDAAAVLFPAGKLFPEGVIGQSLAQMSLVVVVAKGACARKRCKLADCQGQGWVLNPDGCGFRAGLQRALAEKGQSLKVSLEIFGTDLQLGLVANGMGFGLVPEPLLQRSRHRDRLEVISVSDFRPVIDLWLVQAAFVGNLQGAVDLFGEVVTQGLTLHAQA
ncbi:MULTISPECIES: LysR family transcriptional regulator [unclassified Pseudomonas]|uniref:LysR family transcriptional regulator n=1 Tax=unclassified Pseudomonas TaxID=196821 RepID=UPI000BD843D2|nr:MULTISPECIES: LysR family transcriptional regulator [unclassified Pseudomonas]PVZ20768.1 DNA-binding transcriptional LysR family regulator [Pseudomonas sp. URIL14HWK12:I12]PVZ27834.1 DNA-binding transcriptional LysR family regulator [Pseudomonas sp. URIL14HWK12:I10]PVZ38723.1 DNA-binding transcriptional LysR family regulator [Pseudomonas sp. URIL14HWK12:I11]SNZ02254.1 transcriptional regulator, LysR family [Pseudomonas sp. URIL14HWK12:I9]